MNTYRKILILVILLAMLASGCSNQAGPQPTPTMGPVDVVKAYEKAYNNHDIPAAMALLTEDGTFLLPKWGDMNVKTLQEVQKVHDFYFGVNTETHYTDCRTSANTVTCKMTYAEDCSRAYKMNMISGEAVFTILKDKIQVIKSDPASDEIDKYSTYFDNFMSWWEKTYPDEFNSGVEWLSKENGATIAKRCQEYGATLK